MYVGTLCVFTCIMQEVIFEVAIPNFNKAKSDDGKKLSQFSIDMKLWEFGTLCITGLCFWLF